ncbi:peptidylprolyl isomerase [Burkholderia gladioli]|uniref:peptidylprolyl isomerase n=1 Tax=Burkholderia gladioli TaxID=28095 RepID=UPI00163F2A32|nr:peptidylprolyl isomerase [Burkholderia gladioli]
MSPTATNPAGLAAPLAVNGIAIEAAALATEAALHEGSPDAAEAARHTLVIGELLRQRAVSLALLADHAELDDATLDALLARELTHLPEPTEADCRRYYTHHPERFRRGELVHASHILFAVTERVPLAPLRERAETALAEVLAAPERFEALARESSNCPSAAVGGSLGQLLRGDCVTEFEAALFGNEALGVLPGLVNTRHGFHIVRIKRRVPGEMQPFKAARERIAGFLAERVRRDAMRQYVAILAGVARIEGITLAGAQGPLVQ